MASLMCTEETDPSRYTNTYIWFHTRLMGGTVRERWMHAMGLLLLTIEVAMVLMQPTVTPPFASC